ncbi:unnamed protein product [Moneuplotes crassus]|uniref:Uncharacterized protein n=1 Tax=Euplotes crassus TaxID=5936 RepID=A0AAD1UA81_EUPCR|nr:unnamed protein product [Moneuplotes crassus]
MEFRVRKKKSLYDNKRLNMTQSIHNIGKSYTRNLAKNTIVNKNTKNITIPHNNSGSFINLKENRPPNCRLKRVYSKRQTNFSASCKNSESKVFTYKRFGTTKRDRSTNGKSKDRIERKNSNKRILKARLKPMIRSKVAKTAQRLSRRRKSTKILKNEVKLGGSFITTIDNTSQMRIARKYKKLQPLTLNGSSQMITSRSIRAPRLLGTRRFKLSLASKSCNKFAKCQKNWDRFTKKIFIRRKIGKCLYHLKVNIKKIKKACNVIGEAFIRWKRLNSSQDTLLFNPNNNLQESNSSLKVHALTELEDYFNGVSEELALLQAAQEPALAAELNLVEQINQQNEYDMLKKSVREKTMEAKAKFNQNKWMSIMEVSSQYEESNTFTVARQNRYRHYVKIIEDAWVKYKQRKAQKKFVRSIRETQDHLNCTIDGLGSDYE